MLLRLKDLRQGPPDHDPVWQKTIFLSVRDSGAATLLPKTSDNATLLVRAHNATPTVLDRD